LREAVRPFAGRAGKRGKLARACLHGKVSLLPALPDHFSNRHDPDIA
jgi:hypothetical protein